MGLGRYIVTDTDFDNWLPPADGMPVVISERVTLKKFDGNYTDEEIERLNPEPVETIELLDGEIISHWRKEE